jgi:hypothetical protein
MSQHSDANKDNKHHRQIKAILIVVVGVLLLLFLYENISYRNRHQSIECKDGWEKKN